MPRQTRSASASWGIHLGYPLGTYETGGLDDTEPGCRQAIDQLDLGRSVDRVLPAAMRASAISKIYDLKLGDL